MDKISFVKIPWKPDWHGKTPEEQHKDENENYLKWKKEIQHLEETNPQICLTPFEKNIEVWRQLWRVLEWSHIVIQIIDARDPYFYWTEDLEIYAKSLNKKIMLLLNKADLVPSIVWEMISNDLNDKKIDHIFYTAKSNKKNTEDNLLNTQKNSFDVKSWEEIIQMLNELKEQFNFEQNLHEKNTEIFTVGLVGFPNVGKSSIINSLFGEKRVGVDFKPGKTKNLQTLFL